MDKHSKGVMEELYMVSKEYPETQLIQKLGLDEYVETLSMHAANAIGEKLRVLADENKFSEIYEILNKVHKIIDDENEVKFQLPLSMITYTETLGEMPLKEDLFLSRVDVLYNDAHKIKNFFKTLSYEMKTADEVFFLVSFIRMSGAQLLTRELIDLEKRNIPVKVLTTTYLNITEAKAIRHLQQFQNVELKILPLKNESFHTKAYLFKRNSNLNTVIIGSSNISHSALINGHELNVKIPHSEHLPAFDQTKLFFNKMWNLPNAVIADEDFLRQYEAFQKKQAKIEMSSFTFETKEDYTIKDRIEPNEMQKEALKNLSFTRNQGQSKGVIIAATGTGKTYLSAFDVQSYQPTRLLFIAHREELLDGAIKTFTSLFNNEELCGKITGTKKEYNKRFVFSTIQSLSKDSTLELFEKHTFDYIIVDEFHHAEAATYKKVLAYFEPQFLLGLTATPERMDGRDVLSLCDNNVVYEIRLRDALEAKLLAPFHYFGLSDSTVDYDKVKLINGHYEEDSLAKALSTNQRVESIIEKVILYGYDGENLHGLGFCVNIDHAHYMSQEFNKRGFETTFLTGKDSVEHRSNTIKRLENPNDKLTIIFTVNIFNEGIDIPRVNLMLFLRPTESSTIFIQQLGRGLRKIDDKEYVTVLDFIGNFRKSFIIPLALSGQYNSKAFDVDSLRVSVAHEFADAAGGSYAQLDPIAQREILERLETIKLNPTEVLKEIYYQFKHDLGRSPEIMDFLYSEEAPSLTFFLYKHKSWVKTKKSMKDMSSFDEALFADGDKMALIERIECMLPLKWPYEFAIYKLGMSQQDVSISEVLKWLSMRFSIQLDSNLHNTLIERAMSRLTALRPKQKTPLGTITDDVFSFSNTTTKLLKDEIFANYLNERIEYGLIDFRRTFKREDMMQKSKQLALYNNYTRNELIFLFEAKVPESTWREGISRVDDHYLLFINLNKTEDIAESIRYKDSFRDPSTFHWQSENRASHASGRGLDYVNHKERGLHIHLFVRKFIKMHNMTMPFTYLGEVEYVSSHGDKPMNIIWKLHNPVPEDLYHDLIR
jgi:superfamily II DNA or RNA helicase/HKD family nuclease